MRTHDQKRERELNRQRTAARQAVNNAVGELTDLMALLPSKEGLDLLFHTIGEIRDLSERLTPARHGIA